MVFVRCRTISVFFSKSNCVGLLSFLLLSKFARLLPVRTLINPIFYNTPLKRRGTEDSEPTPKVGVCKELCLLTFHFIKDSNQLKSFM